MDSGVNLAASYYQLYASCDEQVQAESCVEPATESSEAPWQADEWTAVDREAASQTLLKAAERCQITSSSSITDNTQAWDRFYGHHETKFFKDRHYITAAFPTEFSTSTGCWVEVGCGVGNALLPLLADDQFSQWTVYGMDLSAVAIESIRKDARFQAAAGRTELWPCDIVQSIPKALQGVATVVSLFFCLSAIRPQDHLTALGNVVSTLRPGGVLVLRDYGRYDEAQLKLGQQRHKLIESNFYQKSDGTKCYYFTTDELTELMENVGLKVLECEYLQRVYQNVSEGTQRRRVWVQGRFQKR